MNKYQFTTKSAHSGNKMLLIQTTLAQGCKKSVTNSWVTLFDNPFRWPLSMVLICTRQLMAVDFHVHIMLPLAKRRWVYQHIKKVTLWITAFPNHADFGLVCCCLVIYSFLSRVAVFLVWFFFNVFVWFFCQFYAKSGWNLNNLANLERSVLSHISADISGMKVCF